MARWHWISQKLFHQLPLRTLISQPTPLLTCPDGVLPWGNCSSQLLPNKSKWLLGNESPPFADCLSFRRYDCYEQCQSGYSCLFPSLHCWRIDSFKSRLFPHHLQNDYLDYIHNMHCSLDSDSKHRHPSALLRVLVGHQISRLTKIVRKCKHNPSKFPNHLVFHACLLDNFVHKDHREWSQNG